MDEIEGGNQIEKGRFKLSITLPFYIKKDAMNKVRIKKAIKIKNLSFRFLILSDILILIKNGLINSFYHVRPFIDHS
jgi:hypothetical protein